MGYPREIVDAFTKLWPLGKWVYRAGNWPVVGALLRPLFTMLDNEAIIIPVHEAVQGAESVVLPYPLLDPLIAQASLRFVMNECMCRKGEDCTTYPHDFGCLFLGDGVTNISPSMGHMASVDEARAHVRRAVELGLVPLVVHTAFDGWMLGVSYRRMLGICFCCDCCCAVRVGLKLGPPVFWDTVVRLPGLSVHVGPECVGCGRCQDVCHVGAISLDQGTASINGQCKGCGRCVEVCPTQAIRLHVGDSLDVWNGLLTRIQRRTDIGTDVGVGQEPPTLSQG
ncbi:MAG: 4Fe-4S binding protein [Anaerolineales bacterium]|nr:4Fe-4S binding protein [Anaerolineales bacterium]